MLEQFGENIWVADGGPLEAIAGFHYPTRMAVMRLVDGGLVIWSPIELTAPLEREVASLGAPQHLIAPNHLHHMFLPDWLAAFPEAKAYAAPGLIEKQPDIDFASELGEQAPDAFEGILAQVVMRGNAITSEVVFFHRESGTVIFTDLLQNFAPDWFSGWRRWVAKLDLMAEPSPTVPRKFRLAFRDRAAARAALDQILSWPIENVLMAHGTPVRGDGRAFVAEAFEWLA